MDTNWSRGSSIWTWGRTSSLWGWRSTGIGCPEGLWSLLLWRYSNPAWTQSSSTFYRWPCFGREVGLDDPHRSLPRPAILWLCDSVIFQISLLMKESWKGGLYSISVWQHLCESHYTLYLENIQISIFGRRRRKSILHYCLRKGTPERSLKNQILRQNRKRAAVVTSKFFQSCVKNAYYLGNKWRKRLK